MLKGRWRCLDASGGRLLYDPEKVCQIILACCVLHNICLSHGIEEKTKCAWTKMTTLPSQLTGTRTSLRWEDGSWFTNYTNSIRINAHMFIFFRMFYLGTFVQRTLNSGQSSATTSLTDSFKSLCEWEEEAGDGQRGPDAGAAGAAAADAASGAARAAGAAAGASETCLLPCHILCFCH